MEMKLLDLVAGHTQKGPLANDCGAVAAHLLLTAPYFQGSHQEWRLVNIRNHREQAYSSSLELVQEWFSRNLLRTPGTMYRETWGREVYAQAVEEIPEKVMRGAQRILRKIERTNPELYQKLFKPTEEQLQQRGQITVQVVPLLELGGRLREILGDTYSLDAGLKTQGIEYHSPPYWTEKNGYYLLAHNNEELAGILHLSAYRDWSYGLNYVSVNPSFREKGVAKQLYTQAIELCEKERKVLVRSSPGDFTLERPAITQAFDRMCIQSNILHVQSSSRLIGPIEQWLDHLGYDKTVELAKPLCDKYSVGQQYSFSGETQELIEAIEQTHQKAGMSSSRKKPKP